MPKVKVNTKAKPAKASAKAASPAKRETARADVDKQRADVAKRLKKGEKIGDIATALHVTPGRAKYLQMLNEVEDGTVASISTNGNDEAVGKRIAAARNKQDECSSWGWISARTGLPEAKVKKLAEDAGVTVKGSHVAKERAAARGTTTKAKASTKAKSTKAKAGKGKGNPSQKA